MIFGDMFGAVGNKTWGRANRLVAALSLSLSVLPAVCWAGVADARVVGGSESPVDERSGIALSPPEIAPADIIPANRELAAVLPEATPMAFFLSTREETWESLNQFELFSRLSVFFGGSLTPRTVPFLPAGAQLAYEGTIQDWMGDQAVIAYLPDTTPRSIEPTDLAGSLYTLVPVADQAKLVPFLTALEASREGIAPEKTVYEGVELWVWPTRQVSLDDISPAPLPELSPEVPAEALPEPSPVVPPLPDVDVPDVDVPDVDVPDSKAADSKAADPLPLPEVPDFSGDLDEAYTFPMPGLTVAMMGDHLVFAQEAIAAKRLIDYQRLAGPSLAENELFLRSQYTETEGTNCQVSACAIARLYGNLSEVVKFNLNGTFPMDAVPPSPIPGLPDFSKLPGLSLSPDMRAMASKTLEGVTFDSLVYPQAEGMRIQGRLYGNDLLQSTATPELPYADSALSFVPAPTYSLSSGRNVAGFWQQVATGLSLNEATRPFLEQAREVVSTATGLDLDTELLGWMDQEFVLFFFPSNTGAINSTFPSASIEVGIAVQTSEPAKAQKALDAMDELVGPYIAVAEPVNGLPAVSWQGPAYNASSEVVSYLSHSWISDDTVLIASGAGAMARLLNATAFEPIDEHPTFTNATDSLAHPNNGYSYLNMGSTLSLIYSQIYRYFGPEAGGFIFQEVRSILGTVRGFGSTTSSTDDYWQLDALMNLAPVDENRPSLSILLDDSE